MNQTIRPTSYREYLYLLAEHPSYLSYTHCISCTEPFTLDNIKTSAGWKETQISGMCESCFDSLFHDEE